MSDLPTVSEQVEPGATMMPETSERAIVTVVNIVGAASMPFNEFVRYRARKFPQEKHIVIVWDELDAASLPLAEAEAGSITTLLCHGRLLKLAALTRSVMRELRPRYQHIVVHLHQPRSGAVFHLLRPIIGWNVPILFTIHNSFDKYSIARKLLTGVNFLLASGVTFVSRASYSAFPTRLHRLRKTGVRAVRNGVDLERVDRAAGQHALPSKLQATGSGAGVVPGLKLINVGRFVEQKNHCFLIELLSQLPASATLTLVGDGPMRQRVARLAADAGLAGRVRFTGLIPREAVYDAIGESDVFVSGSLWEGLPIAVLEAMALRAPVILSDIEPHREIAEVAPAVKVLPIRAEAWRDLLQDWASRPGEELRRLGQQNREAVVAELSLARMHERYTEIYQQVAG
jgi:glycosyltransferase involved in cell wall biosynthesis